MQIPSILGGFETFQKHFFFIFLEPGKKKSEISGKIGFFSGKNRFYWKNRRFFSDFFTSDFSFPKSFPTQPKTDFSPKNWPEKTIFLSLIRIDVTSEILLKPKC